MEILLWIGCAQSLFSATLFLLIKKEKSLSNKLLSAWLFLFAFEFLTTALAHTYGKHYLTNPFLVFNPLLYFYSRSLITPNLKLKWFQLWHVLPYFFIKIGSWITGFQSTHLDVFIISRENWFIAIYSLLSLVSFFAYSIVSLLVVHRYRMNLRNEFSTINSKITLGWLIFVIIFYMTFMVTAYILGFIEVFSHIETFAVFMTYFFLLVMVYFFSFYGLLQEQIYAQFAPDKQDLYKNPRLTSEMIVAEIQRLTSYFRKEKPYLNSELTIYNLSDKLALSRHMLTEILNRGTGKNFYQFVNEYRVEEVKEKLKNPDFNRYSIDAIGFECGFKSKSTFYDVFKKYTGKTPTQYRSSS
jgi:AraC-like DNA-binding protein